jgi:hypothetical protein
MAANAFQVYYPRRLIVEKSRVVKKDGARTTRPSRAALQVAIDGARGANLQ